MPTTQDLGLVVGGVKGFDMRAPAAYLTSSANPNYLVSDSYVFKIPCSTIFPEYIKARTMFQVYLGIQIAFNSTDIYDSRLRDLTLVTLSLKGAKEDGTYDSYELSNYLPVHLSLYEKTSTLNLSDGTQFSAEAFGCGSGTFNLPIYNGLKEEVSMLKSDFSIQAGLKFQAKGDALSLGYYFDRSIVASFAGTQLYVI